MAVTNSTILESIWLEGSNDFQQRVPKPTQATIQSTIDALFDVNQPQLWNEFVANLIGRIGMVIINSKRWDNPLAQFKRGMLQRGQVIQEIGNQLLRAHGYDLDAQDLLRTRRPESQVAYHSINREDRYDLTINETELRKAFIDEYGLNTYVASLMGLAVTSDNYDEFQIMKQLFKEYKQSVGFYQHHVTSPIATGTDVETKAFIEAVRAYTGKLKFLSKLYNKADIPTWTAPENLVLFITPEAVAHIDVNVLAAAFNVSYAEIQNRIVIVDEFPDAATQAILCDRDWFICADYIYQTTSFFNPETLNTNFFLHHWGVYSVSPFMNAIEFTTEAVTSPVTVTVAPSTLAGEFRDNYGAIVTTFDRTQQNPLPSAWLVTDLQGTVTPATVGVDVLPDSIKWVVTDPTGAKLNWNSRVFRIDRLGKVIISDTAPAGAYTIDLTSTYQNPSGATTAITATVTLTVV